MAQSNIVSLINEIVDVDELWQKLYKTSNASLFKKYDKLQKQKNKREQKQLDKELRQEQQENEKLRKQMKKQSEKF